MRRRVVITGWGILSPLGNCPDAFFSALAVGHSGLRRHGGQDSPTGRVSFEAANTLTPGELRAWDRVSQLAVVACDQALASAGLSSPLGDDAGVFFGTGMGGAQSLEEAYKDHFGIEGARKKLLTVPAAMAHAAASHVAIRAGVTGECQTYSCACASSSVAIGEAFRRIRDGYLDVAVAAGAEALLVPGVMGVWSDMKVLCSDPPGAEGTGCRPFSADRRGFALAEGAGALVLESMDRAVRRAATPLAEIAGYGASNDATHLTRPSAHGQALALARALANASIPAQAVGYINAHGTATRVGDVVETQAIKAVFGAHAMPISSTKSAHGHLLGASGVVELIATIQALRQQVIPPTTHWYAADDECDLDYVPRVGRETHGLDYALSNSFAFGGNNAVLAVKRYDQNPGSPS